MSGALKSLVLHGRCVVPGVAEGEALVTHDRISGWGGIDSRTGTIVEVRHALRGVSFAGKVLVFPGAKGSSGAVVTRAPALTDFDGDPLALIETGDWVRVDADHGLVEITKAAQRPKASL